MGKIYIHFASYFGMLVWSIIGFLIWIPVLLVETSTYCYDVIQCSFNGTSVGAETITSLKNKIDMYPRGFRNFELIIKSYSKNYDSN